MELQVPQPRVGAGRPWGLGRGHRAGILRRHDGLSPSRRSLFPQVQGPEKGDFLVALADGKNSPAFDGPDTAPGAAFPATRRVSALPSVIVASRVEAPKLAISWWH